MTAGPPYLIVNKPLFLSYKVPELVTDFLQQADISYGAETDSFAVEIKQYRYSEYEDEYLSSPMFAAIQLVKDMELRQTREGKSWQMERGEAAYVICEDAFEEGTVPHPVVFLVIFDPKRSISYEITIDCYGIAEDAGIAIAESFSLLN